MVNAAKLVNMRRSAELREDVLSSDLILADGMSVVWAARLLGEPLPERVAGIDLMQEMLGARERARLSRVLPRGHRRDPRGRGRRITRDYPKVVIAGRHHGYFEPEEECVDRRRDRGGESGHPVRRDELSVEGALPRAVERSP